MKQAEQPVVDGGNEMLAVETDADTVVSGTLQR